MVWSIIQINIALVGILISIYMYLYCFGLVKYDDEKERRRKDVIAKHGVIMLLCAILTTISGVVLLYIHLSILMSM